MKPVQRSLGIGADHIETVGGVRATPTALCYWEEMQRLRAPRQEEITCRLTEPDVASLPLLVFRFRSESDMSSICSLTLIACPV